MRKPLSVPTQKQPWRMTVSTICTCWRCPMSILADHGMYMIDLDFGRFQTWSWLNPMKRRPLLYWFLGPRSILLCNFGWKHLVLHFFTVSTLIFPEKVDKHISWQDPLSSFSSTSCRFDFSTGIQIWTPKTRVYLFEHTQLHVTPHKHQSGEKVDIMFMQGLQT